MVIKEEIGTDHDARDFESAVSFSLWIPFYPNTRFIQKVVCAEDRGLNPHFYRPVLRFPRPYAGFEIRTSHF